MELDSKDFDRHVSQDHSVWKYAVFIINVDILFLFFKIRNEKYRSFDNEELDYLKHKIEKDDLTWFPGDESWNIEGDSEADGQI